jgi:hypothetical protein
MGKAARNRKRREQSTSQPSTPHCDPASWQHWLPEGPLDGHDPQTQALLARLATEHHMPCTLTYLDDPVFGRGVFPVADITEDGILIPDRSGTVDPIPVVMFEPSRCVISHDSRTGTAYDLLTEAIIAAGFHRIPAGPLWTGRPAQGWGLYRTAEGLVLRDADGAVYAEATTALDPAWVSTATSLGSVLVLHGPCLGIRTPPGHTQASYTVDDRAQEITRGRRNGLLAGATVTWHPEPLEETLNWVLFPPGMYSQPLPIATYRFGNSTVTAARRPSASHPSAASPKSPKPTASSRTSPTPTLTSTAQTSTPTSASSAAITPSKAPPTAATPPGSRPPSPPGSFS